MFSAVSSENTRKQDSTKPRETTFSHHPELEEMSD
jgi:hypothetical protein